MTAEEQAVVLVNEVRAEREQEIWKGVGDRRGYGIVLEALCRAIERHEAFKQEVSDIVDAHVNATNETSADAWEKLKTLIIPKPKPDPLVEVLDYLEWPNKDALAKDIRAALDALVFEIREKGQ